MSALILPRRFYSQPQGVVEIAPEWRARVVAAYIPGLPVHGEVPYEDDSTKAFGPLGRAADIDDTASGERVAFANSAIPAFSGPTSVVVAFEVDALAGYSALTSCMTSNTQAGFMLRVGDGATDSKMSAIGCGSSANKRWFAPSNQITAGDGPHCWGVSWADGNINTQPLSALDGQSLNLSSSGGSGTGQITQSTGPWSFGSRHTDTATSLDGRIYGAAIIRGALTQRELNSLTARNGLWQLFRAPTNRIAFDASVVGGSESDTITPASITITGQTIASTASGNYSDTITPAAITVTGQTVASDATDSYSDTVTPASVSITGQEIGSTAAGNASDTVTPAAITVTGQTIVSGIGETLTPAAITVTGQTITTSATDGYSDTITPAAITITGQTIGSTAAIDYSDTLTPTAIAILGQSIGSTVTDFGWTPVAAASSTWTEQSAASNTWTEQ